VRKLAIAVFALGACSSGHHDATPAPAPAAKPVHGEPAHAIATITGVDPVTTGLAAHEGTAAPQPATLPPAHAPHPIDITLRSTPPGAQVAVDGRVIGATPTYTSLDADGGEHEFTFVLARHAVARYRFVPITSGIIHARLEPVSEEPHGEDDASAAPEAGAELVNPPPAPMLPPAYVPPPSPDAPAVAPPPTGLGPQP
jgi:hypothetical protein